MASPLSGSQMVGFAVTTDAAKARAFYSGGLGFRVLSEDDRALMLDAAGAPVRIHKAQTHTAPHYTVLGWNVKNLEATLTKLEKSGVRPEKFPGLPQNDQGVMEFADGTRLAWLKDPDGNILSVAQMPRAFEAEFKPRSSSPAKKKSKAVAKKRGAAVKKRRRAKTR